MDAWLPSKKDSDLFCPRYSSAYVILKSFQDPQSLTLQMKLGITALAVVTNRPVHYGLLSFSSLICFKHICLTIILDRWPER